VSVDSVSVIAVDASLYNIKLTCVVFDIVVVLYNDAYIFSSLIGRCKKVSPVVPLPPHGVPVPLVIPIGMLRYLLRTAFVTSAIPIAPANDLGIVIESPIVNPFVMFRLKRWRGGESRPLARKGN